MSPPFQSMLKRLSLGAVAGLAILAVSGCGAVSSSNGSGSTTKASADKTRAVHIAVFLQSTENTYFQSDLTGAKQAAKAAGGTVTVKVFDGQFSPTVQLNQIEDANASHSYNAYVVFANDGATVVPAIKQAVSQGIKIVAGYVPIGNNIADSKPQVPGVVATVWHNEPLDGKILANAAIQACKVEHASASTCTIGYISGGNALPYEEAKLAEFKREIATDSTQKLTVVAEQSGNFLRDTARTAAESMLTANPTMMVLATTGDQMTLGAEDAVKSAGLTGKVTLLGDGASTQGVLAVREHRWFSTNVYLPITEGKLATQIVIEATRGLPIKSDAVNVRDYSTVGPIYTQQTTKHFTPQWHA